MLLNAAFEERVGEASVMQVPLPAVPHCSSVELQPFLSTLGHKQEDPATLPYRVSVLSAQRNFFSCRQRAAQLLPSLYGSLHLPSKSSI